MGDYPNQLLARLSPVVLERIQPHLTVVSMPQGEVLADTQGSISKVFFPHSGIMSCVVELIGGGAIETGMIGKDGQFGGGLALASKVSPNRVVMQIAGTVSVAKADAIRNLTLDIPELREAIMAYEQFCLAQVQQTAACNATHDVRSRTCKWLLRMHDLAGPDLLITQEFLAQMMGVRRTSVSPVASDLQKAGLIEYARGRVHIIDIDQIRRWTCECNEAVNTQYDLLVNHKTF